MPVFQNDSTSRLRDSELWCREQRSDLFARQATALDQAAARHRAEQEVKRVSLAS
jgi:hypothetical protein